MNFLIVGASGYLGTRLAEHLVIGGHSVSRLSSNQSGGINPQTGLFSTPPVIEQVDAVIYLAQSPYYRMLPQRAPHLLAVNCISAVEVAVAARIAGVEKFIYASTGNVYKGSFEALSENAPLERENWYSLSKIMGEECLRLAVGEMDLTCMRIFGIYGTYQQDKLIPNLLQRVIRREPITVDRRTGAMEVQPGGLRTNPIYIEDAVRAIEVIATVRDVPEVNVAGDEVLSIRQMVDIMGEVAGVVPGVTVLDRERAGDLIGDVSLFRSIYPLPRTPFRVGIQEVFDALQ